MTASKTFSNTELARQLIEQLVAQGVRTFCLCAGSRNAPLIAALNQIAHSSTIEIFSFFEERSAAFFALGRAKLGPHLVAVITTSGTAAAELLPAAIEATYSGVGLVLITADRPPEHRGTGSPQAIEQVGLFGRYAGQSIDIFGSLQPIEISPRQVTHINFCFAEPLLSDAPVPAQPQTERHSSWRRPLVIVGRLSPAESQPAIKMLTDLQAPILAEAPSGLREHPQLAHLILRAGEKAVKSQIGRPDNKIDFVLRLGSVPTTRLWRDLESAWPIPCVSFSREPFSGMPGRQHFCRDDFIAVAQSWLQSLPAPIDNAFARDLLAIDRQMAAELAKLLIKFDKSEPAWFQRLSQVPSENALVFIGNSLPVREWDLAASFAPRGLRIEANRGANGIDGELSSFLGAASFHREAWGVFGDLTTLYDLSAPWVLPQINHSCLRLVVINNFGGQIFSRLVPAHLKSHFVSAHHLNFSHWAAQWGLAYELVTAPESVESLRQRLAPHRHAVIEIQPDPAATDSFWQHYA